MAVVLILIAGTVVAYSSVRDYYIKSKLDPQVELNKALKNMAAVKSYRYKLESGFTVDNRKEVISRVEGEKNGIITHIKGEMVNTPVNIYYTDSTIYNYDSFSQKWLVIETDQTNSEELLISEMNPLSNFRFKDINEVEKKDFEVIDGAECLVVMCKPSLESELLETLWKDFKYQLWIDYKEKLIKRAVLTANNKQMTNTVLNLKAEFNDVNQDIKIETPEAAGKTK